MSTTSLSVARGTVGVMEATINGHPILLDSSRVTLRTTLTGPSARVTFTADMPEADVKGPTSGAVLVMGGLTLEGDLKPKPGGEWVTFTGHATIPVHNAQRVTA